MNRLRIALLALAASFGWTAASGNPSVYPTGVTRYEPAKAYNGYVLFAGADHKTHLIDMDGREVKRWDYDGSPSVFVDPALVHGQRGHILAWTGRGSANGVGFVPGQGAAANGAVGEVDWDGKVVWSWGPQAPGGEARQHHDLSRLANGNTLILADRPVHLPGFAAPLQLDDVVYEVAPDGRVVWDWKLGDHLGELGFTPAQLALVRASTDRDYLHLNDMRELGPNRWFDAGDKRFAPDNILINSRNASVMAIIDKRSGKIVWRLGPDLPPLVSHAPPPPGVAKDPRGGPGMGPGPRLVPPKGAHVDQFSGEHDAHIIAKGLPGAGDLLVFDNQGSSGFPPIELSLTGGSRILEINPTDATMVWSYTAADSGDQPWTFRSVFISSARRLPNGDTLIDEGMNGRLFQVTPAGEIVWEYVSPYFGPSPPNGGRPGRTNQVYRAQPVPYDWAPPGTPHEERPISARSPDGFRVPD